MFFCQQFYKMSTDFQKGIHWCIRNEQDSELMYMSCGNSFYYVNKWVARGYEDENIKTTRLSKRFPPKIIVDVSQPIVKHFRLFGLQERVNLKMNTLFKYTVIVCLFSQRYHWVVFFKDD